MSPLVRTSIFSQGFIPKVLKPLGCDVALLGFEG